MQIAGAYGRKVAFLPCEAILTIRPQKKTKGERFMKQAFLRFVNDEQGQDIVEYSLLIVIIALGAILVLAGLGTSISEVFTKLKNQFDVLGAE